MDHFFLLNQFKQLKIVFVAMFYLPCFWQRLVKINHPSRAPSPCKSATKATRGEGWVCHGSAWGEAEVNLVWDVPKATDIRNEVNFGDPGRMFQTEALQDRCDVDEELHPGQSFTETIPFPWRTKKQKLQ